MRFRVVILESHMKLSGVCMLVFIFELCFVEESWEGSWGNLFRHSILISPMFIIKCFLFE